jgi:hypothetical protein
MGLIGVDCGRGDRISAVPAWVDSAGISAEFNAVVEKLWTSQSGFYKLYETNI